MVATSKKSAPRQASFFEAAIRLPQQWLRRQLDHGAGLAQLDRVEVGLEDTEPEQFFVWRPQKPIFGYAPQPTFGFVVRGPPCQWANYIRFCQPDDLRIVSLDQGTGAAITGHNLRQVLSLHKAGRSPQANPALIANQS